MSNWKRVAWFVSGAVSILIAEVGLGCWLFRTRPARPACPPPGTRCLTPWGAVDMCRAGHDPQSGIRQSITESIRVDDSAPRADGIREIDVLALSGGGSYGAFGAGFLAGWSEAGTRPRFKIVTGVSTGSLQATFAFLGSDSDPDLRRVYTEVDTAGIYERRSLLDALRGESIHDTAPLRRLIDSQMTPALLGRVAEEHRRGRRLFVGSANIDSNEFVMWDMGAIAASGRRDAPRHYRDVLAASSAVPVLFPPVYFAVQGDGRQYHEMHVDGGAVCQVFFRGFMLELNEALAGMRLDRSKVKVRLFIIRNGIATDQPQWKQVDPWMPAIGAASMEALFQLSMSTSLYRMYILCQRHGIEFNLASIPPDEKLGFDSMEFDRTGMQRLYDLGYRLARGGYKWQKAPPGLDADELPPAGPRGG